MIAYQRWTGAENALMLEHYQSGGVAQMRQMLLTRTPQAIHAQAAKLGLSILAEFWSAEQDEAVRRHLPSLGPVAVGAMVGRTPGAVRARASRLGVRAEKRPREPKPKPPPPIRAMRKSAAKPVPVRGPVGDPIITAETRVTIAPTFVDRRFLPDGPVPRVVDSAECRGWVRDRWAA
jgi:hypothetical protein